MFCIPYLFILFGAVSNINSYVLSPGIPSPVTPMRALILSPSFNDLSEYKYIFPGTKWCGPGDIADAYSDLGIFDRTDACCRAHDYCEDTILSGETRHDLQNESLFTRLNCECDYVFYRCLQDAACASANLIGWQYFNAIRSKCFKETYPAPCMKYDTRLGLEFKCLVYRYFIKETKLYQWFDTPAWT